MTAKFYFNKSEKEKVDKELDNEISLNVILKEESSIINPVIVVDYALLTLATKNYFYLQELGRYYYITEIISISNNLVEITGHVDVLMSFKGEIRDNTAIIKRQENNWNLYLNDGTFRVYQDPQISVIKFPVSFTANSFILAVAGGQGNP